MIVALCLPLFFAYPTLCLPLLTTMQYSYKVPHSESYLVRSGKKWISKTRPKMVVGYVLHSIDMLGNEKHDTRPWEQIVEAAHSLKKDTVSFVLYTSYCQGRPVKMYTNIFINAVHVTTKPAK